MRNALFSVLLASGLLTGCTNSYSGAIGGKSDSIVGGLIGPGQRPTTVRKCFGSEATESYKQPRNASLPSGISFLTDWINLARAGGFGAYQVMDSCRMKYDPSFSTWHGLASVRVEVNPGDDPISSGGERSEVLWMKDQAGIMFESQTSGRVYFGMSYFFPVDFDGEVLRGNPNSWSIIMQLHPGSGNGPFGVFVAGQREPTGPHRFWWTSGQQYNFSDGGNIELGKWVDFIFDMNFNTGAFKIYRRNEGETSFRAVVDANDPTLVNAQGSYFKQGLYRGEDVRGRTDVIWMGPTARGNSFLAVEQAAFGTRKGF